MNGFFEFPEFITDFVEKNVRIDDIESIENAIAFLKENKISKVRTALLLHTICKLTLNQANQYVHNSKAWNA
jgi:hypothetical protein